MADDRTPPDEPTPAQPDEAPAPEEQVEAPAAEEQVEAPAAEEQVEAPAAEEQAEAPAAEAPAEEQAEVPAAEALVDDESDEDEEPAPRAKPLIPGADLEVDIVAEGADPLAREDDLSPEEAAALAEEESSHDQPIAAVTINLAADARYRATGKRKTAVARVTLKPGTGVYTINGRLLDEFFPRGTLQRNIRQPLEAVGYEERMDVVARLHGGGVSSQAGALRHGVSRALLEADPNLRGELKRRGFLTRDSRAKERKKAGLKKARKRPQFSKR
jgi:small subunit ribosomal protein S9